LKEALPLWYRKLIVLNAIFKCSQKKRGLYLMRKNLNKLFKYSTLAIIIIFGFITIIGTGGDDEESGHTANIEGEWDFTYGWDNVVGRSDPQRFVFKQDGKNVTFTGTFVTPPPEQTIYPCEGEGTINGDEIEITAWNDDEAINLTVIFYTGLIDDLETSMVGIIEGDISWEAIWGDSNYAAGIWSADRCGT
jgi:hypothetical protein